MPTKSAYSKYCVHLKAGVVGSSPAWYQKVPLTQGQSTVKQPKRFVMVWSFNGRITGCLPEDMGSIPMQIANRDPFVKRLRHRAFNPGRRVRFPQGLPICIRNSIGRVRSLKPRDAGSKPAGCTIQGTYSKYQAILFHSIWSRFDSCASAVRFRQNNVPCP